MMPARTVGSDCARARRDVVGNAMAAAASVCPKRRREWLLITVLALACFLLFWEARQWPARPEDPAIGKTFNRVNAAQWLMRLTPHG